MEKETDDAAACRIGGLTCGIRLKTKLGFDNFTVSIGDLGRFLCLIVVLQIYEKASDVGGTWRVSFQC